MALLFSEYLDSLTALLNTELAQRGYLIVAEQCRKLRFGIDFMRQVRKQIQFNYDLVQETVSLTTQAILSPVP